jgi:hypothetical protein
MKKTTLRIRTEDAVLSPTSSAIVPGRSRRELVREKRDLLIQCEKAKTMHKIADADIKLWR